MDDSVLNMTSITKQLPVWGERERKGHISVGCFIFLWSWIILQRQKTTAQQIPYQLLHYTTEAEPELRLLKKKLHKQLLNKASILTSITK